MKTIIVTIGVLALWVFSLWIVFWLGFMKSQEVSLLIHHLDDQRVLRDQKLMLERLKDGNVASVERNLAQRIELGERAATLVQPTSYSFIESISYAVYPQEALTLLEVARLQRERERTNNP